ncbi:MAG: peptidylprolyl isomerase, partial [Nitrospirota bacterium]|nr:peptidylprolyl isomerase [Nitrospirota bacterium]
KVPVKIDQQLFDSLDLDLIASQLDTWAADSRIIVRVGSEEISVADFVNASGVREKKPEKIRKKDDVLKSLVNMKLIDIEARSRHYEKQPELAEQVRYYKEYEMRKLFFMTVILPSIDLSDQKVSDYYRKNIDLFKTEPLYRFQRIRLKTEAEAERVLANLNDGSDFFWTAKSKLSKEEWEEDMYTTWLTKKELPEDLKPQMDTLKIGDISTLIRTEGLFVIYRLKEKTDAQVKPFETVRESVRKMVFDSQHEALRSEFARKLRSQSKIVIYDDEVAAIEGMISR